MTRAERLYERALGDHAPTCLLHAGRNATFWAGKAGYLAAHRGAAPVLLVGLYDKFRLRWQGQNWLDCKAALIPPGLSHELDFGDAPFTALYIDPKLGGLRALAPLMSDVHAIDGILIGASREMPLLRSVYEDGSSEQWLAEALRTLLSFSLTKSAAGSIDPRISDIADFLYARASDLAPVQELARRVGLSASRFQHLFTRQTGIPFRRYRAWARLRTAWLEIARGASVTQAAHASGFFDSAHLAHEYRRTFGKPAFNGTRRIVRIALADGAPDEVS